MAVETYDRKAQQTLYLQGEITMKKANSFVKEIKSIEPLQSIDLVIISNGGKWNAGRKINKAILESELWVRGVVTQLAYSLGSFILQFCNWRVMNPDAKLWIHEGYHKRSIIINSDLIKQEIDKFCEDTKREYHQILEADEFKYNYFAKRSKLSAEEVRKLARLNKPIFAPEALEYGLIDEILKKPVVFNK